MNTVRLYCLPKHYISNLKSSYSPSVLYPFSLPVYTGLSNNQHGIYQLEKFFNLSIDRINAYAEAPTINYSRILDTPYKVLNSLFAVDISTNNYNEILREYKFPYLFNNTYKSTMDFIKSYKLDEKNDPAKYLYIMTYLEEMKKEEYCTEALIHMLLQKSFPFYNSNLRVFPHYNYKMKNKVIELYKIARFIGLN